MQILVQAGTVNKSYASGTVMIDDGRKTTEYKLFVAGTYATVATGHALRPRGLGRTFHREGEVAAHYKRHGAELEEVVKQLRDMRRMAAE